MTDWSEYQDDISDAISDSMDMDWSANDGARAVVRWLNENKPLSVAPAPEGGAVKGPGDYTMVLTEPQTFERFPALASHIERMAVGRSVGSLIEWDGFLRELNAALAAREEAPDWTARTEAAWAENNREEAPACEMCNGRGEVGGPTGQTPESFDYVTERCPDCGGTGKLEAPAEAGDFGDALLAFLYRHGLKVALDVSEIEALRQSALCAQPQAREDALRVAVEALEVSKKQRISDEVIDAWDRLRNACERVECSLPHQLSANVSDLRDEWRAFDALLMKEAKS